jgi:hypothetical protein
MSNYILSDNHPYPSMKFEGLARAAFDNCDKYGDPFGIAHQEIFGFEGPEHQTPTTRFRRALVLVLVKLVIRYPDNDQLKELEKRAWTANSQEEVSDIIVSASQVYLSL